VAAERFEKTPEAPHRRGSEVSSRQAGIGESGRPGTNPLCHYKIRRLWPDSPQNIPLEPVVFVCHTPVLS
jgi:hypothetical protein